MKIGDRFLVKVKWKKTILAIYTTQNCRPLEQNFRIGAVLSGFIAGVNDNPNELFAAFLDKGGAANTETNPASVIP